MKNKKNFFIQGAISPQFIAESIAKHSKKTNIGAHSIFLGQVRKDIIDDKTIAAIEYSAYIEMAEPVLYTINEACFAKFDLTCMHIYHSLGLVNAGEICLFVFTSSKHRQNAMEACNYVVDRIKKEVPIWGKEILGNENFQWKENS